eukprot:scaffold25841_cov69-Phaeocystis_antarctica.AAC.2
MLCLRLLYKRAVRRNILDSLCTREARGAIDTPRAPVRDLGSADLNHVQLASYAFRLAFLRACLPAVPSASTVTRSAAATARAARAARVARVAGVGRASVARCGRGGGAAHGVHEPEEEREIDAARLETWLEVDSVGGVEEGRYKEHSAVLSVGHAAEHARAIETELASAQLVVVVVTGCCNALRVIGACTVHDQPAAVRVEVGFVRRDPKVEVDRGRVGVRLDAVVGAHCAPQGRAASPPPDQARAAPLPVGRSRPM